MSNIIWQRLETYDQLIKVMEQSVEMPQLIFKHSTRCGISNMMLHRLERQWDGNGGMTVNTILLDILNNQEMSNSVEKTFEVRHESPQILLITNGTCVFNSAHAEIDFGQLYSFIKEMDKVA